MLEAMTYPTIIPPYLLNQLASASASAAGTLRHDQELRARRSERLTARPTAGPQRSSGGARTVHDAQNGTTLPGKPVRREGDPATSDDAVNEAYDGLGATRDYFRKVHARDSIDGEGMALLGTVHYGQDYDNAFWDGHQMVFGDGDGTYFERFTRSLDVIAHELTHGVTEATAALVYQGQSGALNESVSDVFGSLVKQYAQRQPVDQADWLIGADLLSAKVKGRALRDMLHPGTAYDDPRLGKDPQPDHMTRFVETDEDNGGVHLNSGIPNRAFAVAATTVGGKAWETVGPVWYDVLTGDRIQARCDFATFARLTHEAATARYGAEHAVTLAVAEGWGAVGIEVGGAEPVPDPEGAGAPAEPSAPGSTTITIRRTGGVAGTVREATVDLADLPTSVAQELTRYLQQAQTSAEPAPGHPDAFSYRLTYHPDGPDLRVGEHSLPETVRQLISDALS